MYPTRRMIFVALAGVPLALLAAMVAPSLWLAGPAWTLFSVGLFLLDAVMSAAPAGLQFSLQLPAALSVARPEEAALALSFGRSAPSRVELAFDSSNRLQVVPDRQVCSTQNGGAQVGFSLVPVRRGEGLIETLWTRWQGPLGLCWKQRRDELGRK